MDETKKLIEGALALLSTLSVSGEAVDIMAAAKNKLRRACVLAGEEQKPEEGNDG